MERDGPEEMVTYRVVVNHEEQYSIWPTDRALPAGWRDAGKNGSKVECLAHVKDVWTDMRPLSLRAMMEAARRAADRGDAPPEIVAVATDDEPSLVDRLVDSDHPVEVSLGPELTASRLRLAVDGGYVLVRFTDTRGGTEVGVRLDASLTRLDGADFDTARGTIRLVGTLTLDDEPVLCRATIDLATLAGTGRLERRSSAALSTPNVTPHLASNADPEPPA